MSLVGLIKPHGPSGFGNDSTAEEVTDGVDLSGKTYLLTGCNSGIGQETLRVLTQRGAHVIAAARTSEKARAACGTAKETTPVACELSEPASVRACVETVANLDRGLDGIICNAGIMALPKLKQGHGLEMQFLTNHIGHFILVTGLLESLNDEARVVMVSSSAHRGAPRKVGIELDNLSGERKYSAFKAYGQSKLANLLFAMELAERFKGSYKTANALHPGVIKTGLTRYMNPLTAVGMAVANPVFFKSIPEGAATQCYVATHPSLDGVSGKYFADCNIAKTSKHGTDKDLARRLWAKSEEIVETL